MKAQAIIDAATAEGLVVDLSQNGSLKAIGEQEVVDRWRPVLTQHKAEIIKLFSETRQKGWTLVPLRVYFKHGRAKLELALASGKHNYDKRQDLRKKADQRDIERALKQRQRG